MLHKYLLSVSVMPDCLTLRNRMKQKVPSFGNTLTLWGQRLSEMHELSKVTTFWIHSYVQREAVSSLQVLPLQGGNRMKKRLKYNAFEMKGVSVGNERAQVAHWGKESIFNVYMYTWITENNSRRLTPLWGTSLYV